MFRLVTYMNYRQIYLNFIVFFVSVASFAAASNERVVAFLDISSSSVYKIEQVRELCAIFAGKGKSCDVFLVTSSHEDTTDDLARPQRVLS